MKLWKNSKYVQEFKQPVSNYDKKLSNYNILCYLCYYANVIKYKINYLIERHCALMTKMSRQDLKL